MDADETHRSLRDVSATLPVPQALATNLKAASYLCGTFPPPLPPSRKL